MQVRSLGGEDLLEEEMATHSSILAWKVPWTEEPGGLQSKGLQKIRHDWARRDADKMFGIKLYTNVLLRTMRSKNFGRNRLRVSRRQNFIEEANSMNDMNILVLSLYQLSIQSVSIQVFLMQAFWQNYSQQRRRQWHPTPVLLPGKSHGRRSLVGCSPWGVARSRTRLSDFTFTFHFHALEKEMATHSSVLAWRIPGTGEPTYSSTVQPADTLVSSSTLILFPILGNF